VSSVASVGILSWLLVHPLGERGHPWVRTFARGFFAALIPSVVMLWLAIWKRVDQYGLTEQRYFLAVLSVWLAGVAAWYAISRSRNIQLIPSSLCALALVTFAGPWGAFGVSRRSQMRRLESILARNELMVGGGLRPAAREVPAEDAREVSAVLRYVLETHGAEPVTSLLGDSLTRSIGAIGRGTRNRAEAGARVIASAIGVPYVPRSEGSGTDRFSFSAPTRTEAVHIEDFAWAVRVTNRAVSDSLPLAEDVFVRLAPDAPVLRVVRRGVPVLEIPLQPMIDRAETSRRQGQSASLPPEWLTVQVTSGRGAALARFTQIAGTRSQGTLKITSLEGELFLRLP
jgi:hypothetical protein